MQGSTCISANALFLACMKMNWSHKRFADLSTDEFHDIVDLRVRVFVVEQNCPYPELDGKDKQSTHVIGRDDNGDILAYARIVDPGLSYPEPSIGRVVTHEKVRGGGIGHELMEQSMHHVREKFGQVPVRLSAQEHLRSFYGKHGFLTESDVYLEDDIPHIEMKYDPGNDSEPNEDVMQRRRMFFAAKWEEFESAKQKMLDFVEAWPKELMLKQPGERSWSATQVLDHVLTSEKGTLGYMLKKTQAEPEELPYLNKEDRDKAFKLMRRLQSEERYEAPSSLPPPDEAKDPTILIREWDEMRDRYRHFLGTLTPEYYGRFIFRHPFTGPMSVEETLGFLIDHINHHMHQLERIKTDLHA